MTDEFIYLHKYSLCLLLFEIMKEKHCILSDSQWKESRVLSVTLPRKSHYKLWQCFSSGKFCFFTLPETLGTFGSLDCFSGVLSFKMFLCHPTFFDIILSLTHSFSVVWNDGRISLKIIFYDQVSHVKYDILPTYLTHRDYYYYEFQAKNGKWSNTAKLICPMLA